MFEKWDPRRARSLWLATAAVVLVVGVVILWVVPRMEWFREWRADWLGKESMEALVLGQWAEAHRMAVAAYQLDPDGDTALRAAARLNAAAGHPQAVHFFAKLIDGGTATQADHLDFAEVLLGLGRFGEFRTQYQAAAADNLRSDLLLARYAAAAGDGATAEAALQRAESRPDATEATLEEAAFIRVSLGAEEWARPAVEYLFLLADTEGERRSGILLRLLGSDSLPLSVRAEAARRLLGTDGVEFSAKLRAVEVLAATDPKRAEGWIDRLVEAAEEAESVRDLAAFFVRAGRFERALELIPRSKALSRQDWFIVWLDAMAGMGRWEEILSVLESRDAPIATAMRELYLGRTQDALGHPDRATTHYRSASLAPTDDLDQLFYIAGYLNQVGQTELAETVLEKLSSDPVASRTAWESMVNLHRVRRDTVAMLGALEGMKARWPDDTAIQTDVLYLSLLLDQNLSSNTEIARKLFESHPDSLPIRMTYALALLKTGRPDDGRVLFEGSAVEVGQLLPHQKAIFAALLREIGMDEMADQFANATPHDGLLPQELALLTGTLGSLPLNGSKPGAR